MRFPASLTSSSTSVHLSAGAKSLSCRTACHTAALSLPDTCFELPAQVAIKDDMIVREGEVAREMYFVKSGAVQVQPCPTWRQAAMHSSAQALLALYFAVVAVHSLHQCDCLHCLFRWR